MPSSVVFKQVKPSKMKVDAFRLEFLTMIHKIEPQIKKDFQATVETWDHEVTFTSQISLRGGPSVLVGTDDEIYTIVNNGAPEHLIPKAPKVDGFLVYQSGYTAKTVPGAISSKAGGKFGGFKRRKQVKHPGHVARNFDKVIAEKWKPRFRTAAHEAMKKAVQKCGHQYKGAH